MSETDEILEKDEALRIAKHICERSVGKDKANELYAQVVLGEITTAEYFSKIKALVTDEGMRENLINLILNYKKFR